MNQEFILLSNRESVKKFGVHGFETTFAIFELMGWIGLRRNAQRPSEYAEMGIYRDNLSAIIFYRLSLSLKIVWIYRLPISLL